MFCSSCGTANADGATTCRICGELLTQQPSNKSSERLPERWWRANAKWLLLAGVAAFAISGFAAYYYRHRAAQEFEVTGELLYKHENKVRPVAAAYIEVFQDKGRTSDKKYRLLLWRQTLLRMADPQRYNPRDDSDFTELDLVPPSEIYSWSSWEIERLKGCSHAGQLFSEALRSRIPIATAHTDSNGHFCLKLRRGKYFVNANAQVPNFFRLEHDPGHRPDTSTPVPGAAFWSIPVTVRGNMKVVSAEPACSPAQ